MDGETYGPYSAAAIRDLELLDDVLVTEESMNGQWLPASRFDFNDMVRKESGVVQPKPASIGVINADGTVTNPNGWQKPIQQTPSQPYQPYRPTTPSQVSDDNPSPWGWCILSFLIPLVGWILYFCWRSSNPKKASAVCTWAWIGFVVNIVLMCI